MLNSLPGDMLRGLAGLALSLVVPLSAAAQEGPLTCRAWTDNPVVAGSTPLRAEHINEIRACLEQIIRHLSVTPVDPVGGVTVSEMLRIPSRRYAGWVEVYATLANNTADPVTFETWIRAYDENDQLLAVAGDDAAVAFFTNSGRLTVQGGTNGRYILLSYLSNWATENSPAYWTLELKTVSGVPLLCSGCGRFPWW